MLQTSTPTYVEDLIDTIDIEEYYGYVYLTSNLLTGQKYIGKKIFKNTSNKKLGKKEIAALPTKRGRTPSKKKIILESNWATYYGSSDEVKQWVQDVPKDKLLRVVLRLCKTSKELTYYETKYLFQYDVLEPGSKFVNISILGRFYTKDLLSQSE